MVSAGTRVHASHVLPGNDTGPDDSIPFTEGVFMMSVPGHDSGGRELKSLRVEDVSPTLPQIYGLECAGRVKIN